MEIDAVKVKISKGEYRFSDHALKRMIKRSIDRAEMEQAVLSGEIIEEYPDDKYSPSCLVYGMTDYGRHLHVQLSLSSIIVIITIYEPDEAEWTEYKIRRTRI